MTRTYRWARRAVWGTLAVVMTIGCNPLSTIGFLTYRDPVEPARYPIISKEGPKKDKEEIRVALFVKQASGQSFEFAGADGTIASEMARKIPELAKENKQKVKVTVIPTAEVNKFKMKNPTWKDMHPSAWGKATRRRFRTGYPPRQAEPLQARQRRTSSTRATPRCRCSCTTWPTARRSRSTTSTSSAYPKTGLRDASAIPLGAFKKEYLERLAIELAQYHVDHKISSGIAEGR